MKGPDSPLSHPERNAIPGGTWLARHLEELRQRYPELIEHKKTCQGMRWTVRNPAGMQA